MTTFATRALRTGIFIIAAAGASSAFAHAHLKAQQPAADSEVTASPQVLTLNFSEGVEEKFSDVTLSGPGDAPAATGPAARSPDDISQLVVPVKQSLEPGTYTVQWHVVSVDGHKTKGQYRFRVK